MKPAFANTETKNRPDSAGTVCRSARFPKTDYRFHGGSFGRYGGGQGKRFPSIRAISEEYFDHEARAHFASEAAFFGLIAITVSVPLFEVIRGLVDWVL